MNTAVAVVLIVGVAAYAVFGGADFGAGFWDLTAGGPEQGARPRSVIEHSIGPVWEANHVWLIFIFVVLWTSFSEAYASITLTLFVPLTIAALGIVLRGSSFVPQGCGQRPKPPYLRGRVRALLGAGSLLHGGAMAGGIASGRVPAGGRAGDPVSSWVNPTSVLCGILAVVSAAYLAAVYLVWDARRLAEPDLAEYFRRRAVGAGALVAVAAVVGVFVLRADARNVFDGLAGRALPLVLLSVFCGSTALVMLMRDAARGARLLAAVAVASIVFSWAVAQWPYLLPESLTVAQAASPSGTLTAVLVAVGLAALIVVPGFVLLYVLDQRGLLPEEGLRMRAIAPRIGSAASQPR